MKSGVDSLTCGEGGSFHFGIGGRSVEELALAARGKLSVLGGFLGGGGGGVMGGGVGGGVGGGGVVDDFRWSCGRCRAGI